MQQFLMVTITINLLLLFICFLIWKKHYKLQKIYEVIPAKNKKILAATKIILIILLTNLISYLAVLMIFFMSKGG